MSDRHYLIAWQQLKPQVPFCRQHVGRLEKLDEFPERVRVGARRIGWWQDEVDAWLASRQRGGPAQYEQLGPKPPPVPEPDAQDLETLRQLAARFGVQIVVPQKPERRRGRSP